MRFLRMGSKLGRLVGRFLLANLRNNLRPLNLRFSLPAALRAPCIPYKDRAQFLVVARQTTFGMLRIHCFRLSNELQ